jgi:hypothetical protein
MLFPLYGCHWLIVRRGVRQIKPVGWWRPPPVDFDTPVTELWFALSKFSSTDRSLSRGFASLVMLGVR